jgi:hypothetical protein
MTTNPTPGSVWVAKRRAYGDRRLVEVVAADPPNAAGSVVGVGWWQQRVNGEWRNVPHSSRKTRILTTLFLQRFEPLAKESST